MAQSENISDGREALFQEMMNRLDQLQSRYRGVRGELIAKVREELLGLKPNANEQLEETPVAAVFDQLQAKYRGVRGELLAKVREEVLRAKPNANTDQHAEEAPAAPVVEVVTPAPVEIAAVEAAPVAEEVIEPPASFSPPSAKWRPISTILPPGMMPSCRSCGRTMREAGDGSLVCKNGHVRHIAS